MGSGCGAEKVKLLEVKLLEVKLPWIVSLTYSRAQLTFTANPHKTGRPTKTARAPSANAFNTSVPFLTPPSMYTSTPESLTASTTS